MFDFLNATKSINDMQFGFLPKSNTTSAASVLIDGVLVSLEKDLLTACLFLDISKAFDCVNFDKLVFILSSFGFRGNALQILKSFICGRSQYVCIDSKKSSVKRTLAGVPQGSVLGPLLFIIYINNIFNLNLIGKPILYADDTALTYSVNDFDELTKCIQSDLDSVNDFLHSLNMRLNISKTKLLIFKSGNFSQLTYQGNVIDIVRSHNYLGLIIDSGLKWNQHVLSIKNKLSKYVGIFWRIRGVIDRKTLLKLYFSYVNSQLTYMLPIWGGTSITNISSIQCLQTKILKIIYNKRRSFGTAGLYRDVVGLNILMFQQIIDFETTLFMHKLQNGHFKFGLMVPTNHEITGRITRSSTNLRSRSFITSSGQCGLFYRGITLYNNLASDVKNISSLTLFKIRLRKLYRDSLRLPPR
jgi:hypothetical protein